METTSSIRAVDYHAGGEPFRIVTDVPGIAGASVADKRVTAVSDPEIDGLRALLCSEPRGHADMYGGFIVAPDDAGAHFGVLFWHKDGFSTACGHGTIALGAWAVRSGRVPADPGGITDVVIDVPSGRVRARVITDGDRVVSVDFVSVPSYVLHEAVTVPTSRGEVRCVISFGGAIYAHVPASAVGLDLSVASLPRLIDLSREIKAHLNPTGFAAHPLDERLSGIYGVIYFEDEGTGPDGALRQRNITVFADGEVDRSPCGSGTCSRVAALHSSGSLKDGQALAHTSISGATWLARVQANTRAAGRAAVLPVVTGRAYPTGEHLLVVDPDDDMLPGFVLR
ncbi:MAG: proline racemase family protein [Trebonia sp.]